MKRRKLDPKNAAGVVIIIISAIVIVVSAKVYNNGLAETETGKPKFEFNDYLLRTEHGISAACDDDDIYPLYLTGEYFNLMCEASYDTMTKRFHVRSKYVSFRKESHGDDRTVFVKGYLVDLKDDILGIYAWLLQDDNGCSAAIEPNTEVTFYISGD